MKFLFIYRPNEKGFDDWIHDMPFARTIIIEYEQEWDPVIKFRKHDEYSTAYKYYKRYREYKESLPLDLKVQLIYRLRNGSWRYDFTISMKSQLVEEWLKFECPNGMSRLKRITNEEIGKSIKQAREFSCIGRKEMAELLGISENTYKCYEEGSRSIPYRIVLMIKQIINI